MYIRYNINNFTERRLGRRWQQRQQQQRKEDEMKLYEKHEKEAAITRVVGLLLVVWGGFVWYDWLV